MTNGAVNPATNGIATARSFDILQIHLVDEEGQNILSIDDGAKRQSLRVEIVNTSGQAIVLKDLDGNFSTNYHFCISFRPGTLVDQGTGVTLTVQDGQGNEITGWQIQQANDTFFLRLDISAAESAKTIAVGQRITLVLSNIGAAPAGGSRGTRVEIRFSNLQYVGTSQALLSQTRLLYLNIVNQRGKKQIPLYAGFLGSNTILNDNSENELTLSIQSLPRQSLPLKIEPYSSDRVKDVQSVTSDQTSFGKTVIELLQEQDQFKPFFIDIANRAINEGMQPGIVLNKLFSNYKLEATSTRVFTAALGTITSAVTTEVTNGFKQSIGNLINKNLTSKLLDGQKSIQDLLETQGEVQDSFVAAIFTLSSKANELYNRIRSFFSSINVDSRNLDQTRFLNLILPDSMARLKLFDKLKNENNPAKKQELANALIASVTSSELISKDDLKVILARLGQLNFTLAATVLQNLNIIQLDDTKAVETSVLGFKGIKSGDTLDRAAANAALDESVTIRISFDVATTDNDSKPTTDNDSKHCNDSKHWALVEKTNADDIQITIAQGQENWVFGGKFEQGITPQWSFICKKPLKLTDRQEILRLSIKNLKTRLLSGYANLYVHYENFPGYWDGFITVPIHKGPLVYREWEDANNVKTSCVGIGTDKPQAKLHVKSSAGVVGLRVDGDAAFTEKVGIGVTPGTEQLKVQGDTAIAGNLSVMGQDSVAIQDYTISVRASGHNGDAQYFNNSQYRTSLKISNTNREIDYATGLNTVVLNPNGAFKTKRTDDIYNTSNKWNDWATWISQNTTNGDVVIVASYDAVKNSPQEGRSQNLLKGIGASDAFSLEDSNTSSVSRYRAAYILLFIKGYMKCVERQQSFSSSNPTLEYQINYLDLVRMIKPVLEVKGATAINGSIYIEDYLQVNGDLKVAKTIKIGGTTISEYDLSILKKLANSQLTVGIKSSASHYLDNRGLKAGGQDSIQFREGYDDRGCPMVLEIK